MSDDRTPLDDFETADLLHRMVWDLAQVRGETTRGDTALKASRAALALSCGAGQRAPTRARAVATARLTSAHQFPTRKGVTFARISAAARPLDAPLVSFDTIWRTAMAYWNSPASI